MNIQVQYLLLIILIMFCIFALTLICCLIYQNQAFANVKTNINEVIRFFDDEIKNKDQLLDEIELQKQLGTNAIESGDASANIVGVESAEGEASSLSSIRAVDLDDAGRNKRISKEYSFYDEGEFEPDWTKPGNRMHKEDADEIVAATAIKIKELLSKLQEAGVICTQKKGPIQKEPVYTIQLKRENQKNTEYDQFFCEEPRGTYRCYDSITIRCLERGMRWDPWQYREVDIAGDTVYHGAKHLGYAIKWKRKRWGWHLHFNSPGWRVFLSQHLNIPLEQMEETIHFPAGARGLGGTHPVYERWRIVFDRYRFGYNYREGEEICIKWSEDWTERCTLQ